MARQPAVIGAAVAVLVLGLLVDWRAALLLTVTLGVLEHRRAGRPTRPARKRRTWTDEERRSILDRDGWACVYCGSNDELEIDHVIPFSRGGACTVENAQVLCGPCNRQKGAS